MVEAAHLVEVWRGDVAESVHLGHAAIWHADHGLIAAWGDADRIILPRSACKMVQALPLVESGAADRAGLTDRHLALACASHQGAAIHSKMVDGWLRDLGLGETDLRCGPQEPSDITARDALIRAGQAPDQRHNNCSGKHTGFLTLNRDMGGGPEYIDPAHPVQKAVRAVFEEVTLETIPCFAIDGCSAPNFAVTLKGLARAMAGFAAADTKGDSRSAAMVRLRDAMMAHPDLVAGEGRACTRLMRAMNGRAAIKTGAEGVFVAILPDLRIGMAVKAADGATRAAEAVITTLLCGAGVLDPGHDAARSYMVGPIRNRRDIVTGHYQVAEALSDWHL